MLQILLALLTIFSTCFCSDERFTIATCDLESGSVGYIDGCVNVISGDFSFFQTDLTVEGPEPLTLERVYSSGGGGSSLLHFGWSGNCESFMRRSFRNDDVENVHLFDAFGRHSFHYGKPVEFCTILDQGATNFWGGVTNLSHRYLSAHSDIYNRRVGCAKSERCYFAYEGDGSYRFYKFWKKLEGFSLYPMRYDSKPSGLTKVFVRFFDLPEYPKRIPEYQAALVKRVELKRSDATRMFSSIEFSKYHIYEKKTSCYGGKITATASDGTYVEYTLGEWSDKYPCCLTLKCVKSPFFPKETYEYRNPHTGGKKDNGPLLKMIKRPDDRVKIIKYYSKKEDKVQGINVRTDGRRAYRINRVKRLLAPCGKTKEPIEYYTFTYHDTFYDKQNTVLKRGQTNVEDALKRFTKYFYNENCRMESIERFEDRSEKTRLSKERFSCSSVYGRIGSRTFYDEKDRPVFCRTFRYDTQGNLLMAEELGNIKGTSHLRWSFDQWEMYPEASSLDAKVTRYRYCDTKLNRLLSVQEPSGKIIEYNYIPNTNLIKSKIQRDDKGIVLRTFYSYQDSVICEVIEDDGPSAIPDNLKGVTSRIIKTTKLANKAPYSHPIEVTECYVDLETGEKKQIMRICYEYDSRWRKVAEAIYDANDEFCLMKQFAYDDHNNVILEVDSLGNSITKTYDANDNLIWEKGPSPLPEKVYLYDFMNRLIEEQEIHEDGTIYKVTHSYDLMGNKVETCDEQGRKTFFVYDGLNRLIETRKPSIVLADGKKAAPIEKTEYDCLGGVKARISPSGHKTTTECNVFLKPVVEVDPLGHQTRYIYNLDGQLKEKIDPLGISESYEYDAFSNRIKTRLYDPKTGFEEVTYARYRGSRLLEEVDEIGVSTFYRYDFTGRLSEKERLSDKECYSYDAMGRCNEVRACGENGEFVSKRCSYDPYGQKVEEWIEDETGKVSSKVTYTYDNLGNLIEKTTFLDGEEATCRFFYDARNRAVLQIDPLSQETSVSYDDFFVNDHGLPCTKITSIDPSLQRNEKLIDQEGRELLLQTFDPSGVLLAKKEKFYNLEGQISKVIEHAISKEGTRVIETRYEYDALNRLVKTIEAAGSDDQKITCYTYNAIGLRESVQKADGTLLFYTYDAKGRLTRLFDKECTLDQVTTYDAHGNAALLLDKASGTLVERVFDESHRLLKESYFGQTFTYEYDGLGRKRQITYPDGTAVEYRYSGPHLKEVVRLDKNENLLYSTVYDYDSSGRLSLIEHPLSVGKTTLRRDRLGRITLALGPSFANRIEYDAVGNVTRSALKTGPDKHYFTYTYDALYQLASETGIEEHFYESDSLFNHVRVDGEATTLNSLNQMLQDEKRSFRYDKNGNRIEAVGEAVYGYDALDRLVFFDDGKTSASYVYDNLNRRLQKRTLQAEVTYWYTGQDEVGSVNGATLLDCRVLGFGLAAEIGATCALEKEGAVLVPMHDQVGNIVSLLDANGPVCSYRYSAFGIEDPNNNKLSPYRFCSKRVDNESGFVYFGRRFYDPRARRFIHADPLGIVAGPNLYAYVENRPTSRYDAYGLFSDDTRSETRPTRIETYTNPNIPTTPDAYYKDGVLTYANGEQVPYQRSDVYHRSMYIFSPATQEPKAELVHINGIKTSLGELIQRGTRLRDEFPDANIHLVFNSTNGFFTDLEEVLTQRNAGKQYLSDEKACKGIRNAYRSSVEHGTEMIVTGHSQGGTIVKNSLEHFSDDEKKNINVYTYGGASFVDPSKFKNVANCICENDPIPKLANGMYFKSKNSFKDYNLQVIPGKNPNSRFEHSFEEVYYDSFRWMVHDVYSN